MNIIYQGAGFLWLRNLPSTVLRGKLGDYLAAGVRSEEHPRA